MSRTAAVVPLAAAAAALVLLCGWTAAGRAGRPEPVEAAEGRILVPVTESATAAFFTLRNPGDVPDELTGASWEPGGAVALKQHLHRGAAGSWAPAASLAVPARGELRMSPEGADLLIPRPPALTPGQWVAFTLHFRHSPDLTVRALAVVPAGNWAGVPHDH
ncbi:copper chaperone PCu(A)C [Kitasatospora cinereorecta]|uniref:Copper chaperone PCu(A)C n=1 Tax=Kitasatospora cinereorecta TaxID=285560 RepID=A0ABW0VF61_9ACTN